MRAEVAPAPEARFKISTAFDASWDSRARYLVECGGRGSGKSEFAARKIIFRCLAEGPGHRFLVLRKVRARCRESVLETMRRVLVSQGIPYEETKTERTLRFLGNEVLFDGLDDPEKIKSIKGVTGLWIEEATEFSAVEFMGADLVLREPGPGYHQVILTFNPDEAQARWLKDRFFDHKDPDALVHESTIDDNPIDEVREAYRARLDAINDETYREIYRFGKWAVSKGIIFNWPVAPLPAIAFDEIWYGGDFGYSVDPAALNRIYRKANKYWVQELIYQTGLVNQALAALCFERGVKGADDTYWDSAEPKSIEELRLAGMNAKPSVKGPDSVRASIDFLKSLDITIVEGSDHLIDECRRYKWREDKDGKLLPEPVKFDDHAIKATIYGIYSHAKAAGGAFLGFSQKAFY